MKLRTLATFLFATFTAPLFAQDLPKPGPEHQKLHATAGTWDAVLESTGPDGKPQVSKGVSENRVALGGFWMIDDFHADWNGMKFQGQGVTGFDPLKGKYVGTWIDSMMPHLMVLEGSYDKAGKVLTMSGTGIGMDGKPAMHRMTTTHRDVDTMVFEMFVTGADGKEAKSMTITYTRRAAKDGKGDHGGK